MKRRFRVSAVAALGAASVCAPLMANGTAGAQNVINAKFALAQNYGTPMALTIQRFDALVKRLTHGSVNIKLYANNVLGTQSAVLNGVENNTIQFQATGAGLDSIIPSFDATALPYLFPTVQNAQVVLDNGSMNKVLWNKFEKFGLHYVGMYEVGMSDLLSKTPVRTVAQYKGLTVRVFDETLGGPEFKLLGADAVHLSASEIVTALSTGTINAADDPPSTFYAADWYTEAHDIAIEHMTYAGDPVMVSQKFWKSLSQSQRTALTTAYRETAAFNIRRTTGFNNAAVKHMQAKGIVVTHPNRATLAKTVHPVYGSFLHKYPTVVKRLEKEVKKVGPIKSIKSST